jgi:aquaporin NIP
MKKYLAEFIGTFAIVFCGTGAIIADQQSGGLITNLGISITFGLIVMTMIISLGDISGAHFNPAVTIGFYMNRKIVLPEALKYIIFQIAGALAASLILKSLFPENVLLGSTHPSGTSIQGFLMEMVLSLFLMFVILNVARGGKEEGLKAAIAIGSVVLLEAIFGGPVSGASMNPARSIGPAVISGHFEDLWIYIFAPVSGMILAWLVFRLVRGTKF